MEMKHLQELNQELSASQARQVTDKIRAGLEGVYQLIQSAYSGRAWGVLGYRSWDDYVQREFGNLALRPPLEDRKEVVLSMREAGMSMRAIATATQLGYGSVHRELDDRSGDPNGSPVHAEGNEQEPKPVDSERHILGMDGRSYPAQQGTRSPRLDEASPEESSSEQLPGQTAVDDVVELPAPEVDLDAILDSPAEDVGIQLLDAQEMHEKRTTQAEKILAEFHGSDVAVLEKTLFLAEKVGSLVSPVSGTMNVDQSAYSHVAKDIAAAVRQFAHVAKTLAGAQVEFQNEQILNGVIEDLQFAHKYLLATVSEMEEKK